MPSEKRIKESSPEEDDEPEGDENLADDENLPEEQEAQDDEDADDEDDEDQPVLSRRERAEAARSHKRPVGRSPLQKFKARFRDLRLPIYAAFFAASLVVFMLGTLSYVNKRFLGPWMEEQFNAMGAYRIWVLIAGVFALMASSYYYGALITKRREFHVLVATKSKGDFVRNQDKIERLAFELGSRELELVATRKKDFRIRH